MTFERRADRLEEIFGTASSRPRPNPDVIDYLDILEELRRLEFSRPSCSRGELLEVAIARHFEKQGRTAAEISELLPRWREKFEYRHRQITEDSAR